ncbi:hypothetical protein BGZ54_002396, partial [Gamsiella multidivaricata]
MASKQLKLRRVLIPLTDDDEELSIMLDTSNEKRKRGLATRLSKVFPTEPPKKTIHIIVQRPPP